jgi:dihydroxycyclohexadiene carboxylate dehydrogenase
MTGELDPRAVGARRLKDKVCIVTGAGQGIGGATARRFGQECGNIVIANRVDKGATEAVGRSSKTLVDLSTFAVSQELMQAACSGSGAMSGTDEPKATCFFSKGDSLGVGG